MLAGALKDTLIQQNDERNTARGWYRKIIMATKKVHYFLEDSLFTFQNYEQNNVKKGIILVVLLCWVECSLVPCVGQLCPPSNVQNVNYVSCSCIWWVPRLLIMRRRGCWGLRCNAFSSSSRAMPLLQLLLLLLLLLLILLMLRCM